MHFEVTFEWCNIGVVLISSKSIQPIMSMRIDWKRSMMMSVVLIAIMYGLRYVIVDRSTYYMVVISLFVVFMVAGNLLFRRRRV